MARTVIDGVLRRAVDRGEVHLDCPATGYVADTMMAVVTTSPMLDGAPMDRESLWRVFEDVLIPALLAAPEAGEP
jgi:hypothetical protein